MNVVDFLNHPKYVVLDKKNLGFQTTLKFEFFKNLMNDPWIVLMMPHKSLDNTLTMSRRR
jgi:hypothetical protein